MSPTSPGQSYWKFFQIRVLEELLGHCRHVLKGDREFLSIFSLCSGYRCDYLPLTYMYAHHDISLVLSTPEPKTLDPPTWTLNL